MEFEDICKENYRRIYNYILAMTGNVDNAQDIVQDTFLIAYQKGSDFLKHENKTGFLYKTAHNLVMENSRKFQKEILPGDDQLDLRDVDVFDKILKEHYDNVDEMKYKAYVLSGLNENEKYLYEEYYVKKRKMREISKDMLLSETALRMKYVRLRRKIKKAVGELKLNDF